MFGSFGIRAAAAPECPLDNGNEHSAAWSGQGFGGTAQRLAAKQDNRDEDDENEADRAAANPDGTGNNRQE